MSDNSPLSIDIDLGGISTAAPLIADNTTVKVRLQNITQSERDGNPIIKWELRLIEPAATQDGGKVPAGYPVYVNFDPSQDWLMQKMSRFVDGFLGTGDRGNTKGKPERPRLNADTVAQMLGQEAYARVVIQRSKKSDYVGNDVSSVINPTDFTT